MANVLHGHSILIVEDEALIVLDVTDALTTQGAKVATATTLRQALALVDAGGITAAVLNHALSDGDTSVLCDRLKRKGIPFIVYTGITEVSAACSDATRVTKPASHDELVAGLQRELARP
jgi:DNA-binding response OmpR family regulator